MRKPTPGYKEYKCLDCNFEFTEKTRDYLSQSISFCPRCKEDLRAMGGREDKSIKVGSCGNLKSPDK